MSQNENSPLSQDTVFDLLSNTRRRYLLKRLNEVDGQMDLGDLSTEVAAMENDISPDEVSTQQRKRTYVSLYQTHVPKLVEAGVIQYDQDAGTVALDTGVEEIAAYFGTEPDVRPWHRLYVATSVVGLSLYLVSIVALEAIDPILVGAVVLFVFAGISVWHFASAELNRSNNLDIPVHVNRRDEP